MELREWLIILGLALVSLIVVDGVRRLQRQRRVPRLDQAVNDLPAVKPEEFDDDAKEAEINWELPNGGARVVKPADYSGLGKKPKLERQEHPGPSKVLNDFKHSFSKAMPKHKFTAKQKTASVPPKTVSAPPIIEPQASAPSTHEVKHSEQPAFEQDRREPSMSMADNDSRMPSATAQAATIPESIMPESVASEPTVSKTTVSEPTVSEPTASEAIIADQKLKSEKTKVEQAPPQPAAQTAAASITATEQPVSGVDTPSATLSTAEEAPAQTEAPERQAEPEPVLRAEPEDAVFAKHASDAPKRRQLRSDTVGEHDELDDDAIDEYRLVDFEGIGRSFKRRLIERRKQKAIKKAEKAKRAEALAKQKAERKALEAEQRREAKEAAEAEKARIAQERAEAREAAASAAEAQRIAMQQEAREAAASSPVSRHDEGHYQGLSEGYANDYSQGYDSVDEYDEYVTDAYTAQDRVVRAHPALEKALRHDVNGAHAKETLTNADEMVVISVLSRDLEGFDGAKLLELMMVCGLRYSREMGVFHRFETESADSELQFSMVNVLKPGTFPIEEMDEFVTPGITFLMPLPGATDSSAAFEAMVETAMVLVRHMGGELKDENRSVMTAQTIEFARQRVHEFERRHRLHRQLQAR
ncbi:cell division protein ZipA [Halomonas sp. GFAJ-1]|uniref:cell division protein ZipA n=1 Tax=Halomonas sp. GFAJ-1 TaxID=1118153 RepID=UPI00023A4FFE|nr:cell division protein ZipA [Halomonas sp. GFAJ-1]AVI61229.1 cell division protein ZipA [Halomonas sp. GFAJ-1]EHK61896.1 cell division protein ZipA [Halomonas sp. GFAJ-1]